MGRASVHPILSPFTLQARPRVQRLVGKSLPEANGGEAGSLTPGPGDKTSHQSGVGAPLLLVTLLIFNYQRQTIPSLPVNQTTMSQHTEECKQTGCKLGTTHLVLRSC